MAMMKDYEQNLMGELALSIFSLIVHSPNTTDVLPFDLTLSTNKATTENDIENNIQ